ncbi:hypothetical protein [Streptomyces sp. NPDC088258]|uniref:hypothetical protein n=1 Tax=Streptomyces sp. NPDC088258 TaxID=3365849 RepID=UPI0037F4C80D
MGTTISAQVGQKAGALTCCGRPMQPVDSGIYECRRCDCYVISGDDNVIEKVRRCGSH